MKVAPGDMFKSSLAIDDPNFINAIILIVSNDRNGSLGFVINKIYYRTLNELTEFKTVPCFPLYIGGPVDQEHLYMIHSKNNIINGGEHIASNLYYGGAFEQAILGMQTGMITTKDMKLFLGYCGWDAHELENEIDEGSWEKIDAESLNVFE